jgi:hypothetical protein
VGDALGETPIAFGHPCRHRARCGGERGAFANPKREPGGKQADQSADRTSGRCRRAHDQPAHEQRPARTEPVADIAADQLEQRIGIGERRKNQAEFGVAQPQVRLDQRRGCGNVDPIHVEDQVHQADDQQNRV